MIRILSLSLLLAGCAPPHAAGPDVPTSAVSPASGAALPPATVAASPPCTSVDRELWRGVLTVPPTAQPAARVVVVPLALAPLRPEYVSVEVAGPTRSAEDAPIVWGGPLPLYLPPEAPGPPTLPAPALAWGVYLDPGRAADGQPAPDPQWKLGLQRNDVTRSYVVAVRVVEPQWSEGCAQ